MPNPALTSVTESIKEITQLFTFSEKHKKPYFDLVMENQEIAKDYLERLKKEAKRHKIEQEVFVWDPSTLTIRITKRDFIQWQKAVLTEEFGGRKKINVEQRKFFKCDSVFFTIPLMKEIANNLKYSLEKNASQHDLKISFSYNEKDDVIEISDKDYLLFKPISKAKAIPFNKIEFKKDEEKKCYFTHPVNGETLKQLATRLRTALTRRKVSADIIEVNYELKRVEIGEAKFPLIQRLLQRLSLPKILSFTREYHEGESSFYTHPVGKEKLDDLYDALQNSFDRKHKNLNIKLKVDDENNCVHIEKEKYKEWKEYTSRRKLYNPQRTFKRIFTFDQEMNCYVIKADENEKTKTLFATLKERCEALSLPTSIFNINYFKDQVEISEENYKRFVSYDLEKEARSYNAYSAVLTKGNKVYYHKSKSPSNMTRSFNNLAELLNINVKFVTRNKVTEISEEDYKVWIANPIIERTLNNATSETPSNELSIQAFSKSSKEEVPEDPIELPKSNQQKRSRLGKAQTLQNTEGGVSAKYLEDATTVPWSIHSEISETVEENHSSLSSKGRIIPFYSFQSNLAKHNLRMYKARLKFNSQGIKACFTLYTTQSESINDVFSKNVVFVRAGRKEDALLPAVNNNEKTVMVVLLTQQEYDEMEKKLSCSPIKRLPSHIKLCVIESCSIEKQPEMQADSYLRASNVKRIVAFALAEKYKLKHFILMDDNTTQIQIAEKVAKESSLSALFELFGEYKARGTVCATLGTYAPYKNISEPLEATAVEEVNQRLGSKIMYIDFETISNKLKSEKIQMHEILSPFSLWWGEDYFNMLGIIKLMENNHQSAILGIVPYRVAWHLRSQAHKNKEKSISNYQLANAWLNIDEKILENLTIHQKQVIERLQNIVAEAKKAQELKEQKYFEQLAKQEEEFEEEKTVESTSKNEIKDVAAKELGKLHGVKMAKRGYELDVHKLSMSIKEKYDAVYAGEYIQGFKKGHEDTWALFSDEERAFRRGFREGYLAAKKGHKASVFSKDIIPALHKNHHVSFLKGFNKGNAFQWKAMKNTKNHTDIVEIAKKLGIKRAKTGFEINQQKLSDIAEDFGGNASFFIELYIDAFKSHNSAMSEEEIVIKKAIQVAKELSKVTEELNMTKLENAANAFDKYRELYIRTVIDEYDVLHSLKGHKAENKPAAIGATR